MLILTMHHIISDGWSLGILQKEFFTLWNNQQTLAELPPLKIQYKDFAAWQNQQLKDSQKMQQARAFWQNELATGGYELRLPVDYPPTALTNKGGASYRIVIAAKEVEELTTLGRHHQASLFMVLFAAFNQLIWRFTGQTTPYIGIPAAGREQASLQGVIGFFVNTLVVHTGVNPEQAFSDFLNQVREHTMEVLQFQTYPLELICEDLGISYPKIPVFFNMLNFGTTEGTMTDLAPAHQNDVGEVKFELVIYLNEFANGLEICCHYRTGLFKPETIELLLGQYAKLLSQICANPELPLKEFELFSRKRRFDKIVRRESE